MEGGHTFLLLGDLGFGCVVLRVCDTGLLASLANVETVHHVHDEGGRGHDEHIAISVSTSF